MTINIYAMCLMNQKIDFISKTCTKTIPKELLNSPSLSKDMSNHESITRLRVVVPIFIAFAFLFIIPSMQY